jgi:hypothetical protein
VAEHRVASSLAALWVALLVAGCAHGPPSANNADAAPVVEVATRPAAPAAQQRSLSLPRFLPEDMSVWLVRDWDELGILLQRRRSRELLMWQLPFGRSIPSDVPAPAHLHDNAFPRSDADRPIAAAPLLTLARDDALGLRIVAHTRAPWTMSLRGADGSELAALGEQAQAAAFSPDHGSFALLRRDGVLEHWSVAKRRLRSRFATGSDVVGAQLAFRHDSEIVAAWAGGLVLSRRKDGAALWLLRVGQQHADVVLSVRGLHHGSAEAMAKLRFELDDGAFISGAQLPARYRVPDLLRIFLDGEPLPEAEPMLPPEPSKAAAP